MVNPTSPGFNFNCAIPVSKRLGILVSYFWQELFEYAMQVPEPYAVPDTYLETVWMTPHHALPIHGQAKILA